jgi:ankyrin repeat protein
MPTVLEWLKDMKTVDDIRRGEGAVEEDMTTSGGGGADDDLLLSRLTSQRDKQQNGSTPLHLAASLEGWEDEGLLPVPLIHQVWAAPEADAATLLLDANLSTAYQADDEGWYPIHIAAHAGSLRVVSTLLERCPDCATMRDAKGRTFLHVAVEKEHHVVVGHVVCSWMRIRILNARDSNGDTALGTLPSSTTYLIGDRQVRLDVTNKDGMTPLDLSRSMIPYKLVSTSIDLHIYKLSYLRHVGTSIYI